ncbi:MAG: fibronectin type III domain-containing protein, partial [Endomicrobia bacterium]|nr:fibronectin type III domain-containing protein [Endomicrobiia bacterium]
MKVMKIKLHIFLLVFFLTKNLFAKTGQSIDSWVQLSTPPGQKQGDGVCVVYAKKDGKDKIYSIQGGTNVFQIYDIETDVWISTTPLPYFARTGAAMTWDGGNFLYILLSGTTFYQFDIRVATFTRLADPPGSVVGGGAIVYVSTQTGLSWCYAFQGGVNSLWRYNLNTNSWGTLTGPGAATNSGSAMVWTNDEFIYALIAGASPVLRRYNINTNTWSNLANTPANIGSGASIVWDGLIISSNIYALRGNNDISFWKYNIATNSWVWLSSSPVIVGNNSGNRLARVGDYIYGRLGSTNDTDSFWRYRWRDVDPPGKITGFVAVSDVSSGTINLSWVCPGNDVNDLGNYVGSLPLGSTFYIQYSSMTENVVFSTSSPQNVYSVWIPTGPIAQGQKVGYTISNLVEGATYYFRIWARDNAGNWSEISDGATTWAQYTPLASPPESLTAISISSTAIKLVWISSTGAVAHRIEHSSVSYPSYNWISRSTVSLPTQEYTDVGLIPGVTYWYRIIAINSAGRPNEANPSNVVSTITYTAAPQNFSAYKVWVTSIVWRWETLGFADGFRIYRATDNSLVDVSSTTEYLEKNLSTNTAYGRYVRAYNIMGESLNSNHATFYTLAAVPTELQILEVYSSSVTIKWNNNTNPEWTRYGVAVAEDENFTVNHSTKYDFQHNLTAVSTTVFGLGGGTTYYFRVWAYNGDGIISGYSNVVSTVTLPGAPSAPTWLVGVALSTISLRWEWNIVRNATYYQIYDGQTGQLLANLEGTGTTTWIDVNLSSNTRYYRYVKAGNQYGLSAPSDIVSKYTLAYPPESLNVVSKTSSTVTLFWNDSGAFKYEIRRSTDGFFTQVVISTVSQTSFVDIGLIPGATYWYRVYAVNYDSETTTAIYAGVSTRTLPSPVVNFSVVTRTTSTITWSWSMSAGADGYKIYRANDDFYLTTVSAVQYVATGLSTNTVFGIYVVAFNTSGESLASPKSTCYT